ncbi:MAG: LysM peptidoglycan-binding domain-containing protein [Puniceicoccales bacterium]|jgi:LysM repeat protein|nr:LysM peptidoglycan-binding domain-containing protein [Puniceicoccales bacterium]
MTQRILKIKQGFVYLLLSGQGFWFQGCSSFSLWSKKDTPASSTVGQSTLVKVDRSLQGTQINENIATHSLEEPLINKHVPTASGIRALPRRPSVPIEENFEEEDEIDENVKFGPTEDNIYVVRKGDSLWAIARKHHVSLQQLMEANHLNGKSILQEGMHLTIPTAHISTTGKSLLPVTEYVVQKGDTLSRIGQQYHLTVNEIKAYNHLKSDVIFMGQKLKLQGVAQPVLEEKKLNVAHKAPLIKGTKYIVQAGDTLSEIAMRSGLKVDDLIQINDIKNPKALQIGQVIYLGVEAKSEVPSSFNIRNSNLEERSSTVNDDFFKATENHALKSTEPPIISTTSPGDDEDFESLFDEDESISVVPLEEVK